MGNTEINKALEELMLYKKDHQNIGKTMLDAYGGKVYPLDLLATATLHRSINLLIGFCILVDKRNMIAAAPLLRLQIDNCARFFAAFIVDNPHDFAISILKGVPVNKVKDIEGRLLSDAYLIWKLSKSEPWIGRVYKESSGWVHLSDKHFFNSFRIKSDDTLEGYIGLEDPLVPDHLYKEAITAFGSATELLFKYINGWIYTKSNPELVQKAKNKFIAKYGYPPSY